MGNGLPDESVGFRHVDAILGWSPGQVNEVAKHEVAKHRSRLCEGLINAQLILARGNVPVMRLTVPTLLLAGSTSCVALRSPECDSGSRARMVKKLKRIEIA